MKNWIVLLVLSLCCQFAFAKSSVDGLLGFSLADKVKLDGGGDLDSDPALVLGGRYSADIGKAFGYNVGATLDSPRDVGSGGKLGFLTVFANLTYNFQPNNMYAFFGLNLPLIIYEDKNMGDVNPVLGVQLGSGYWLTPKLAVELLFRTINFEIQSKDANLWGFGVQVAYKFASF